MIRMGIQQAFKAKPPRADGGRGGGGGSKMLKTVGGMLYRGMGYRLAEVAILYGVKAASHWLILRLLHRVLSTLEVALSKEKAEEARASNDEEELEEIGSLKSLPQAPRSGPSMASLAKNFGLPFLAIFLVDYVFKYLVSHPFEVMSARGRVSMPERQGSLWSAFLFRLLTRQMK